MSEPTRRTWVALGLAEGLFVVVYPGLALAALRLPIADSSDGWADLALFAAFLIFGAFALLVGTPVAVHTVGRYTARVTEGWSLARSSVAHLAAGAAVGVIPAALLVPLGPTGVLSAVVALVVPAGLAAYGTNLLMPFAMRHAWLRVTSWAIAAIPVLLALVLMANLVARNV